MDAWGTRRLPVFARLSKGEYVASSVIDRICQELRCDVGDVMEVVPDDPDEKGKKVLTETRMP